MDAFIGLFIFVVAPIALLLFIGYFFKNHPLSGKSGANLFEELERFKIQYPGVKGSFVYWGILVFFFAFLAYKLFVLIF
jgi:hypothetical protein